jgi:hypothetical protein
MLRVSIHDKRFVTTDNPHGVSGSDTVFHYWVDGSAITGTYSGGRIRTGHLVGQVMSAETIEMLFQCLTTDGELLAGQSRGEVTEDAAGRARLEFEWSWLTGDRSGGRSRYVELRETPGALEKPTRSAVGELDVRATKHDQAVDA